jgi:hypothetical protein
MVGSGVAVICGVRVGVGEGDGVKVGVQVGMRVGVLVGDGVDVETGVAEGVMGGSDAAVGSFRVPSMGAQPATSDMHVNAAKAIRIHSEPFRKPATVLCR